MKRLICMVAVALLLSANAAMAQRGPLHNGGSIGFHNSEAPLGIRWWFNHQRLALDAGVGFSSQEEETTPGNTETFSHWAVDAGLPILLKSWGNHVHFMLRPGILYRSQEVLTTTGAKDTDTELDVLGELEAEYFLIENVSLSASTGIGVQNFNPAEGASTTDWSTFGANFTQVGFHVYLWSPEK
jgi:hypothetical protein